MVDIQHGGSGHSTLEPSGDFDWGGSAGLLAELSRLLEGGRCEWLEEEICPGIINREQRARGANKEEEAPYESRCCPVETTPGVYPVQKYGHNRRYTGRERCVYCLWFDPKSKLNRDGYCEHVARAVKEWQSQASPSIQPGSLLQVVLDGIPRDDESEYKPRGAKRFASYLRWVKLYRRRGGKRCFKKDEVDNSVSQASVQSCSDVKPRV